MLNRSSTRRQFLQAGSVAAMATAVMPTVVTRRGRFGVFHPNDLARAQSRALFVDPDAVRALALRAIDAAKSAGAVYAEARLTRTVSETFNAMDLAGDREDYAISVRALVNGAWGFAASPYWDVDEAAQLARDAVAQAATNAAVSRTPVDMGHYPVATGSWRTPVRLDPFHISLEEKIDFLASFDGLYPEHVPNRDYDGGLSDVSFERQERAIATTEGAYFTQTLYRSGGTFLVTAYETVSGERVAQRRVSAKGIGGAGAGWELLLDAKLRDQVPGLMAEAEALLRLPQKPVELGRYDLVLDAQTTARLVNATLAGATQVDRVMGFEANASGTSYLGPDPFKYLGAAPIGSPLLTVRGDRSTPRGLATVKWDNEGVEPEPFDLISNGVLIDYQTTREEAAWLTPWYQRQGRPARSHGCAGAASAIGITQQMAPNLSLVPGAQPIGFDELVAGTKRGLAFLEGFVSTDFQDRTGVITGVTVREITNGKLGALVTNANVLFDSMHVWQSLRAIGGAASQDTVGMQERKGEPAQVAMHSVSAVPSSLTNMVVVDLTR